MKIQNLLFIAAALLPAVSCEKSPSAEARTEESLLSYEISSAPLTRAQTSSEQTMKTLDVFVFLSSGQLENYLHSTPNSTSASGQLKVSLGTKTVAFVANMPAAYSSTIKTVADLEGIDWLFADNDRDAFVMTLMETGVNVNSQSKQMTGLQLMRHVSRVQLLKVTNGLPASLGAMTLEGAWLYNVPRHFNNASYTSDDDFWRRGPHLSASTPDNVTKLTDPSSGQTQGLFTGNIATGESWNANTSLGYNAYGYPNAAPEASDASGKDYVTKLVIQVRINGVTYYYPIGIKDMARNMSYTVNELKINRLGTDDPDKYVSTATLEVSITVSDWTTGTITGSYNGSVSGGIITF